MAWTSRSFAMTALFAVFSISGLVALVPHMPIVQDDVHWFQFTEEWARGTGSPLRDIFLIEARDIGLPLHPQTAVLLHSVAYRLFRTPHAILIQTLLFFLAGLLLLGKTGERIGGYRLGICAMLFYFFSPYLSSKYHVRLWQMAYLFPFLALSLWVFFKNVADESGRSLWLAWGSLGLATHFHPSAAILGIPFLAHAVLEAKPLSLGRFLLSTLGVLTVAGLPYALFFLRSGRSYLFPFMTGVFLCAWGMQRASPRVKWSAAVFCVFAISLLWSLKVGRFGLSPLPVLIASLSPHTGRIFFPAGLTTFFVYQWFWPSVLLILGVGYLVVGAARYSRSNEMSRALWILNFFGLAGGFLASLLMPFSLDRYFLFLVPVVLLGLVEFSLQYAKWLLAATLVCLVAGTFEVHRRSHLTGVDISGRVTMEEHDRVAKWVLSQDPQARVVLVLDRAAPNWVKPWRLAFENGNEPSDAGKAYYLVDSTLTSSPPALLESEPSKKFRVVSVFTSKEFHPDLGVRLH